MTDLSRQGSETDWYWYHLPRYSCIVYALAFAHAFAYLPWYILQCDIFTITLGFLHRFMYTVIHTHTTQRHVEHTAPSCIRAITRAHQESKREAFIHDLYIHTRHARDIRGGEEIQADFLGYVRN